MGISTQYNVYNSIQYIRCAARALVNYRDTVKIRIENIGVYETSTNLGKRRKFDSNRKVHGSSQ